MRMRVIWWVGAEGAVIPDNWTLEGEHDIAVIYRRTPGKYRYAVGYMLRDLTVLDLYLSRVLSSDPFLVPHFVDKYVDIDQAVAALTINYQ